MFFNFLHLFLLNVLASVIIISNGITYKHLFNIDSENDILESALYGLIFISIITFIVNFIFEISNIVSLCLIFLPLIFIKQLIIKNKIIKILKLSLILSALNFVILIFDNTYRPDAGLYHLPFTQIINESKIIIGSANLHFRFGHSSILQYASSAFNNQIFTEKGILLPLAFFFSIPVAYLIKIFQNYEKKIIKSISIIFLFNIIYSHSRYSGLGNDGPAHIFFYIAVINFFIFFFDKSKFKNVIFFSLFAFLIKPFLIIALLLPLIIIIIFKLKIFTKLNFFITFISILWLFKNFLISSCFVYPVTFTCDKSVLWSTYNSPLAKPDSIGILSEAWAKAIPDYLDKTKKPISMENYIKNFFWLNYWKIKHLKVVVNKIAPQIIILLLFLFFLNVKFALNKSEKTSIKLILIISFVGTIIWFLKFPTYRYGQSYLITLLNFTAIAVYIKFKKLSLKKNNFKNFNNFLFLICLLIFFIKHTKRIYENFDLKYYSSPWPKMYSYTLFNNKNSNKIVKSDNGDFLYYEPYPSDLCMYSKSPCSNQAWGKIKLKNKFGYKIYYLDSGGHDKN